jgi:sialate O-acetylesterase
MQKLMKFLKTGLFVAFFGLAVCLVVAARAEVKPSTLFSDHAVLQSGMAVPIWGTADPGEKVTVGFEGQTKSVTAGADGKWMVRLTKLKPGGPLEMTIAGKNSITVKDVLVGEVWVGSGQSNMEANVSRKGHPPYGLMDEEKEIAAANYPQVRMFTVKDAKSYTPKTDVKGEWKVCSPETVADFSAVGYLFARNLNQALKEPVGIILSAYGASTAESWVPREAMAADPQLKPLLDKFDARETFYKDNPGVTDDKAPGAPQTLNARPGKPGAAPSPMRDPVQDQHQPTVLYNGMISPIIPYAIRGAIWYQGESIVGGKAGVMLYPHVMETLVTEWRKRWGQGNFPFYAVQLAALKNVSNNPMVREQQAAILSVPNTGLAITIDIGDPTDVHAKNKAPLGDRLTKIALANAYGRTIEYSGPVYASMKVEGGTIRVKFTHAQGLKAAPTPNELVGLYPDKPVVPVARPAPAADGTRTPDPLPPPVSSSSPAPGTLADAAAHLHWFQIAGADGKFVDAEAKIDGDSVVVSSPQVSAPVAVRYAWDNYPAGANLYNGDGLPAAPFRTDKTDVLTAISAEFTGK